MSDAAKPLVIISDPQQDRYASLHSIDWWDQERIKNARVMVVGAGALGNEVLKNLALLGIGNLFIVDFDVVEASNLTRSVLFRLEDGGRPKALVAAERIRMINPDVHVGVLQGDVIHELGTGVYRHMDVVISCLDNRAARLAVNRACWQIQKPWIDGALGVLSGLMRSFVPPNGACYECNMTERDYQLLNIRYSCPPGFTPVVGREPTIPTTVSLIAALQVQEALKLLYGMEVAAGHVTYYSGEAIRFTHLSYPHREDCPAHNIYETVIELPASVNDLTVEQFVQAIVPFLEAGMGGTIFLPRKIATVGYCSGCERRELIYRPYDEIVSDELACTSCGTARIFDVTGTLATQAPPRDVLLKQLAIPPWHILPVRMGKQWLYFELSGDKPHMLADWQK
jgi:molybdopterin-synthase adenylyltransferase